MRDFDGSQLFYRLAFASGMRAADRNGQAEGGASSERMARSFDARFEAVVLLQASAEAWINRAYEQTALPTTNPNWRGRWKGIGKVAQARQRPWLSLTTESGDLLDEVSAIRNFLLHGDTNAKERLATLTQGADLHDFLTIAFIERMFQSAERLWDEARSITGLNAPTISGAWVAWDEVRGLQ